MRKKIYDIVFAAQYEGLSTKEATEQLLDLFNISGSLPISKVVFFRLVNGKYLASNGAEVTTAFLLEHEHTIYHDGGYVVVER